MTDHSVKNSRLSRRRLFGSAVFTAAGLAVCFVVLVGKPQTQPTQFPGQRIVMDPTKVRMSNLENRINNQEQKLDKIIELLQNGNNLPNTNK